MALPRPRTAGLSGRTTRWRGWRRPSDLRMRFCRKGHPMPLPYCSMTIVLPAARRARGVFPSVAAAGCASAGRAPACAGVVAGEAAADAPAALFLEGRFFETGPRSFLARAGRVPPGFLALGIDGLRTRLARRSRRLDRPAPPAVSLRGPELHQPVEGRPDDLVPGRRPERFRQDVLH